MSFRPVGFRPAVLGVVFTLASALSIGVVTAQEANKPAAAASAAQPAAAASSAPKATATTEATPAAATAAVKPGDAAAGAGFFACEGSGGPAGPASLEQTGQAPQPWRARTRLATTICCALVARSAREA